MRCLAIEINFLPTYSALVSLSEDFICIVEVTPAELSAVGIINWCYPLCETGAPEHFGTIQFLEHAAVLRHGRGNMIVKPHHDQIALAPAVAIDKALRALEIFHDWECNKMLQSRKLGSVNPAMKEYAVKRIHRVLAFLKPVARRMY